jgi:uncharacterized protein (UPF0264 family)
MTKKQVEELTEKAYEHGCMVAINAGSLPATHVPFSNLRATTQKGFYALVRYVLRHGCK